MQSDEYGNKFKDDKFEPRFVHFYKEYLDSIGLTKNFCQSTAKPVIITDFANTGRTLNLFRELLSTQPIGIKEGESVKFMPLTACDKFEKSIFDTSIHNKHTFAADYNNFPMFEFKFLLVPWQSPYKKYTAIPTLGIDSRYLSF